MPTANPAVVTLGSHTALQIAKGASDEDLKSVIVATPKTASLYPRHPSINKVTDICDFKMYGPESFCSPVWGARA
jgi:5-formaminoimidazole-4-carboxamide-1-(beta)-D-ribofuranosyl 5'-monophosphate synthetase